MNQTTGPVLAVQCGMAWDMPFMPVMWHCAATAPDAEPSSDSRAAHENTHRNSPCFTTGLPNDPS